MTDIYISKMDDINDDTNKNLSYGEITVDNNNVDMFSYLWDFCDIFGQNEHINKASDIVVTFEDDSIYDNIKYKVNDSIDFSLSKKEGFPIMFILKRNKKQYFFTISSEHYSTNLKKYNIFSNHFKYSNHAKIDSMYNCIYHDNDCNKTYDLMRFYTNVFYLTKIKSYEYSPRFIFAYDKTRFERKEIMCLLYYIFYKNKNNNI